MDVKNNPAEIKSAIARLEYKLETEVMPFRKRRKNPQENKRIAAGVQTIRTSGRTYGKYQYCCR